MRDVLDVLFAIVAAIKWIVKRPLSYSEIESLVDLFEHNDINLEQVPEAKAAALQVRLRSVIQQRFMPKGQ